MQDIKYVKNEKFHTTLINFIYQFKCDKQELMSITILSKLLNKTNSLYKEESIFQKEKLNRYIINYNCSLQSINDVYFINFSLLIPNTNIIDDSNLKKQILFLLDTIYNTNLNDDILFNKEKKLYIEILLNNYKNIDFIAEKEVLDLLDNECLFNKIKYKDIENIQRLNKLDVINSYNKFIKNIMPKIFINGNINIKECTNIISDYISNLNLKPYKIIQKYNKFYINNDFIEKKDTSKYYQSIIYVVYNVKSYKEKDFYKLYLINFLLSSGSSGLLLSILRKKSNLVYTASSHSMLKNGLLFIKVSTEKRNIDLCLLMIKELINDLNNIDKYKENINNIVTKLELEKERELDNFYITSNDVVNEYFKTDIKTSDEIEIIKNISLYELKDFVTRLNIVCQYVLKGDL